MTGMEAVEIVVAHHQRATVRVGDTFLKIDSDQARIDAECAAMLAAPIPTPEIMWRKPSVLALAGLPGTALGRLGEPSSASPAVWAAAGSALRTLHDAPLPPRLGRTPEQLATELDAECAWLIENGVLPAGIIACNRRIAEVALRPWTPAFTHGDLQVEHVFVNGDTIVGVIDWSEAAQGDPMYDLATLTLGHPERLGDVVSGYGVRVDLDVIRAWWSVRSLRGVRWLIDHGFDPTAPGREVDVLRARASRDQP
ncbi:phosphotransferase [Nocardia jejuensis]|uniref:phosphotransferase n=1 Tax=Nocardia jejuensis TaxID=328049 RepID=UPI001FE0BE4A|nr:aminoglycoside phosphotransferase family protein [Nocardia jejuensis]